MQKISAKITGQYKNIIAIFEDKNGKYHTLSFTLGYAEFELIGGGLAWLTVIASGDAGNTLEIKLFNAADGGISPDHTYQFDTHGKIIRSFQFNPDA